MGRGLWRRTGSEDALFYGCENESGTREARTVTQAGSGEVGSRRLDWRCGSTSDLESVQPPRFQNPLKIGFRG